MPRVLKQDAVYHVIARANRMEYILKSCHVKGIFLEVIEEAKEKFEFELRHFCIMSNHVHLLIKPLGEENLSRIMQWILSVFAIRFNKTYGLKGHVWYDRFRSFVIESFRKLIKTFAYISNNPVEAGIAKNATKYYFSGLFWLLKGDYHILARPDPPLQSLIDKDPTLTGID